jgi:micrococcal nuclease
MTHKNFTAQKLDHTRYQFVNIGKYLCIFFLLPLLALLRANLSAAVDTPFADFHGVVAKVIDGDSLIVQHKNSNVEIRLYGIDAPEYQQAHATEAKRYLARMVNGKDVKVYPLYYDFYHRVVALLEVSGDSVNKSLVASGNAWVYPHYCQAEICRKWKNLQAIAQRKRTGIWQDDSPVPPWIWKHRK